MRRTCATAARRSHPPEEKAFRNSTKISSVIKIRVSPSDRVAAHRCLVPLITTMRECHPVECIRENATHHVLFASRRDNDRGWQRKSGGSFASSSSGTSAKSPRPLLRDPRHSPSLSSWRIHALRSRDRSISRQGGLRCHQCLECRAHVFRNPPTLSVPLPLELSR